MPKALSLIAPDQTQLPLTVFDLNDSIELKNQNGLFSGGSDTGSGGGGGCNGDDSAVLDSGSADTGYSSSSSGDTGGDSGVGTASDDGCGGGGCSDGGTDTSYADSDTGYSATLLFPALFGLIAFMRRR